ncbi:hypothetical protein FRB90_003909 [Tulasnella sp. 427]|nr:hypothetical protein FRB90_003909 [Tulasnella sp. 427]
MAPTLFTLSVLAASLAGVLAEPNGGSYIGDNDEWTPKFAATAWAPSRRGNNGGVHLFFTGSDDCNGIQQVTLRSGYHGHHRRADPSQSLHGGSSSLTGNSNSNNANSNSNSNNRGQSNSNSNSQSVLHKRVYVQNDDTQEVAEYTWSDATVYTEVNNLYATKFVETGAAASAASLQVSRGKPNLFLWTVGSNGGNVMEDDDTHGTNAKAGTALAAASAQGWGGSSYVFFINTDGHLVQSNRDGDGDWHENVAVKFCDDD